MARNDIVPLSAPLLLLLGEAYDVITQVLRLTFKSKWVVETDYGVMNLLYCELEVIPSKLCDGNYASR